MHGPVETNIKQMLVIAILTAIQEGLQPLVMIPPMRLSEWAAEHFYLSAESSYTEEKWQAYPYQTAIMDCFGSDDIEEIDFKKSARMGYTKMLTACIGYTAQHKRRNQCVWQPTDKDSDDFSKDEIDTMLRDVAIMATVFPEFIRNSKANTLSKKKFLGCLLHFRGGKAAGNYRRITIDTAYLDEIDKFDQDIEKEGDPFNLAWKRTEGAVYRKIIVGTSPKLYGFSHVQSRYDQADVRLEYHIPCPHCETPHVIRWGGHGMEKAGIGMIWKDEDTTTVRQLCPHCGTLYTQAEYFRIWHRGIWMDVEKGIWIDQGRVIDPITQEWQDTKFEFRGRENEIIPTPRHVALHAWTAYSPQATWPEIVREYVVARQQASLGETSKLKTFTNTTLGDVWQEEVEKGDPDALQQRAEDYLLNIVPRGVLTLMLGIDIQGNRFELFVWGFGRGEESWLIDFQQIMGINPYVDADYAVIDKYVEKRYPCERGGSMGIESTQIDSGYATHNVYRYVRSRQHLRVYATKGDTQPSRDIKARMSLQDIRQNNGTVIKKGLKLWFIGTDSAKDLIYGRLQIDKPGPGYIHLSKYLPRDFFEQLTSEVRIESKQSGEFVTKWAKPNSGTRNEALDGLVECLFGLEMLKARYRWNEEQMWREREYQIIQPGLWDEPEVKAEQKTTIPTPKPLAVAPKTLTIPKPPTNDEWSAGFERRT